MVRVRVRVRPLVRKRATLKVTINAEMASF